MRGAPALSPPRPLRSYLEFGGLQVPPAKPAGAAGAGGAGAGGVSGGSGGGAAAEASAAAQLEVGTLKIQLVGGLVSDADV